jgi:hypothetical protein
MCEEGDINAYFRSLGAGELINFGNELEWIQVVARQTETRDAFLALHVLLEARSASWAYLLNKPTHLLTIFFCQPLESRSVYTGLLGSF